MATNKRITRRLLCPLTDDEQRLKGHRLAQLAKQLDDVEAEKKEVARDFKDRIDGLKEQISELSEEVRSKHEWRAVECFEQVNVARMQVELVRSDTYEVEERRPATAADLQRPLAWGQDEPSDDTDAAVEADEVAAAAVDEEG